MISTQRTERKKKNKSLDTFFTVVADFNNNIQKELFIGNIDYFLFASAAARQNTAANEAKNLKVSR